MNSIDNQNQIAIPYEYFMLPDTEYSISFFEHLLPQSTLKQLFHYTNVEAFLQMIHRKKDIDDQVYFEMFASQIEFLNDKAEFRNGLELIKGELKNHKGINKILSKTSQPQFDNFIQSLNPSDDVVTDIIREIYIICFSRNGNSLTQWKYYGKESGIAIGYNLNNCKYSGFIAGKEVQFAKKIFGPYEVIYDDAKKKKIIKTIINDIVKAYKLLEGDPDQDRWLLMYLQRLYSLCPLFKHADFSDEKECRLIFRPVSYKKKLEPLFFYRDREGILVPYLKIRLYAIDKQKPIISSIKIGPGKNNELVAKSIKHKIFRTFSKGIIPKIDISATPFRG